MEIWARSYSVVGYGCKNYVETFDEVWGIVRSHTMVRFLLKGPRKVALCFYPCENWASNTIVSNEEEL